MTDNTRRTLQDVWVAIKDRAKTSSVNYLFEKKGVINLQAVEAQLDEVIDKALEIEGVEDLSFKAADEEDENSKDRIEVLTEASAVANVAKELKQKTLLNVLDFDIKWVPNADTVVDLPEDSPHANELFELIGNSSSDPDVIDDSNIYQMIWLSRMMLWMFIPILKSSDYIKISTFEHNRQCTIALLAVIYMRNLKKK